MSTGPPDSDPVGLARPTKAQAGLQAGLLVAAGLILLPGLCVGVLFGGPLELLPIADASECERNLVGN